MKSPTGQTIHSTLHTYIYMCVCVYHILSQVVMRRANFFKTPTAIFCSIAANHTLLTLFQTEQQLTLIHQSSSLLFSWFYIFSLMNSSVRCTWFHFLGNHKLSHHSIPINFLHTFSITHPTLITHWLFLSWFLTFTLQQPWFIVRPSSNPDTKNVFCSNTGSVYMTKAKGLHLVFK